LKIGGIKDKNMSLEEGYFQRVSITSLEGETEEACRITASIVGFVCLIPHECRGIFSYV
jgi:hypothetical protein